MFVIFNVAGVIAPLTVVGIVVLNSYLELKSAELDAGAEIVIAIFSPLFTFEYTALAVTVPALSPVSKPSTPYVILALAGRAFVLSYTLVIAAPAVAVRLTFFLAIVGTVTVSSLPSTVTFNVLPLIAGVITVSFVTLFARTVVPSTICTVAPASARDFSLFSAPVSPSVILTLSSSIFNLPGYVAAVAFNVPVSA